MTKRTSIKRFAAVCGLFLLYSLWCLRPFMLGDKLLFPDSVPQEAREFIGNRHPAQSFSFADAAELLLHPVEGRRVVRYSH